MVSRVEFYPEGIEPTNEPPCVAIISNLFIFNNFLTPTTIQSTLVIFDHVTSTTDGMTTDGMTHNRCLRKQMAQQMFLTLTIETDGFDPHNRNRWQTGRRPPAYGFYPHNKNRWSTATQ